MMSLVESFQGQMLLGQLVQCYSNVQIASSIFFPASSTREGYLLI